jgi:hypothetical protein
MQVDLSRFCRLTSHPKSNNALIHAAIEQRHRRWVPQRVWSRAYSCMTCGS